MARAPQNRLIFVFALTCGLALAAGIAGCGTGANDASAAREAVQDLRRAFAERDWPAVCERLTDSARREAGFIAHGQVESCPKDLRQAFGTIDQGNGLVGTNRIGVGQPEADGDRATVTVSADGWRHKVGLVRHDDAWMVDSFFGTAEAPALEAVAASRTVPFPPAGHPVRPTRRRGSPCGPLSETDYPTVSGGCALDASGEAIDVTVLTPFGHFHFGQCDLEYEARVDGQGRTWTQRFEIHSPHLDGCSDLKECSNPDSPTSLPWKGRLTRNPDGTIAHTMRACLSTCIGYFTGDIAIQLAPTTNGWEGHAANADIGTSGMRLNGNLDVEASFTVASATTGALRAQRRR